jgi:uncharacterized protein (DUF1800 family)
MGTTRIIPRGSVFMRSVLVPLLGLVLAASLTACGRPPEPVMGEKNPAPLDTSTQDLALLNRVTWGGNAAGAQMLAEYGSTSAFLEAQLHPGDDDGLPADVADKIAAMTIAHETPEELLAGLRDQRQSMKGMNDPDQSAAAKKALQEQLNQLGQEAATRSLLRDLYSKNQLKEEMTWFWFNHFNVSLHKAELRALVGDYEEHAIRPHVFGRFRDLLSATLHHPAMLRYLDNAQNMVGRINENYAREIMELHTLGVNGGYTQKDVQELARILTGVGVAAGRNGNKGRRGEYVRDGLFEFNPKRHDYGDKVFLGHAIKGTGLGEVDEAIDILSTSPATAAFVSRKIALYFVSDNPSPALVAAMAATFQRTDGNIAQVLRTMFATDEFKASLGTKFKDPIHFVVSAMRLTGSDQGMTNMMPVLNWLNRLGEPLFAHETPDGYPLTEASWAGSGDLTGRFEIARIIGSGRNVDAGTKPVAIADTRYYAAIRPTLSATTVQTLAQAKSPQDWNMLFLSSPEFMHR